MRTARALKFPRWAQHNHVGDVGDLMYYRFALPPLYGEYVNNNNANRARIKLCAARELERNGNDQQER